MKKINKQLGLKTIYILIAAYLIVSLSQDIWQWQQAQERIQNTETRLKQLATEEINLKSKLQEIQTDNFIESEVRNKLHLGKPGEKLVILPDQIPQLIFPEPTPSPQPKPNWQLWADAFRLNLANGP